MCCFIGLISTVSFSQNANTLPPAGNVGVGTTTPLSKLHIKDDYITLDGVSTNWKGWMVRMATPINSAWVTTNPASNGYYLSFGIKSDGWYWGGSTTGIGSGGNDLLMH